MLTLEKFEEASEIVKRVTRPTKLIYSEYLSSQTGGKVYLKPENMQYTGAYKLRGAYYKISTLSEEDRAKGLITASAGNHAQGVAYAAKAFGCKATIVMPTVTPLIKVNRTKSYGAEVVLYGQVYDEACAKAYELSEEYGYTFVHPFDDFDVATGQGTIAMEIVQELPTVDYILAPIGGGGLITGVSTLAKMLNPKIKVIGVEPAEAASMTAAIEAGHTVTLPSANTIADGTAVKKVGEQNLPYVMENVDQIVTVEDDELVGGALLSIAVGKKCQLFQLSLSYQSALTALKYCRSSENGIAFFDDMTLEILLSSISEQEKNAYLQKTISALSDEERNLLQTYFEANMSLLGTSQKLFLHKNTVQYKLNHIYQKCGLNPRVFKDAVLLYLALQL